MGRIMCNVNLKKINLVRTSKLWCGQSLINRDHGSMYTHSNYWGELHAKKMKVDLNHLILTTLCHEMDVGLK